MKNLNERLEDFGYTEFKDGEKALARQLKMAFLAYMVGMILLSAFGLYMTSR